MYKMHWLRLADADSLRFALRTIALKDWIRPPLGPDASRGFAIEEAQDFAFKCEVTEEDCVIHFDNHFCMRFDTH